MAYFDTRLAKGEQIVHQGRFHWFFDVVTWFYLIVLGIILVGIYLFIVRMVRRFSTEMIVTNRRVLMKTGLLNVNVDSLTLEAVESVKVSETLLGRILGFGEICVHGKGDVVVEYPPTMAKPGIFNSALEDARAELN